MKRHAVDKLFRLLTFALLLASVSGTMGVRSVRAQSVEQAPDTLRIVLKDGSVLVGTILSQDSARIEFRTLAGARVTIPTGAVLEQAPLHRMPTLQERSPQDDVRLFLAPTAKTLPRGYAYFGVYEIFFPHVAAGITDWFTLAGGLSVFPALGRQWVYVAPKFGLIQRRGFQFAVGGFATLVSIGSAVHGLYGVVTIDWRQSSLTVGVFDLLLDSFDREVPFLVVGGRVGRSGRVQFLTENYIDLEEGSFWPGFGVRFGGTRVSADLAFQLHFESSRFWMLPWISFVYVAR